MLETRWPPDDVLAMVEELIADRDRQRVPGFVPPAEREHWRMPRVPPLERHLPPRVRLCARL